MNYSSYGTEKKRAFEKDYETYIRDIYRLCFSFMKNHMDAEDVVQETFLKYYNLDSEFESEAHKKAWLIVTASNCCKNMLKHWWRPRKNIDDFTETIGDDRPEIDEMMEIIIKLPAKYKTVIYLYYYEGYNSREIAKLLNKPESTIRTYLQKAKKILKEKLD